MRCRKDALFAVRHAIVLKLRGVEKGLEAATQNAGLFTGNECRE